MSGHERDQESNRNRGRMADFLEFDGLEFVTNLYWTILQRAPDELGLSSCLHQLLVGGKSKRDLVLVIAGSEEARRMGFALREDPLEKPPPFDDLPSIDPVKRQYEAEEFLGFTGEPFLRLVYRSLVKRDPTEQERHDGLACLASGEFSKKEMIAFLSDSPEGKSAGVAVGGISRERRLLRLSRPRILGGIVHRLAAFSRMDQLVRDLRRIEWRAEQQAAGIKRDNSSLS